VTTADDFLALKRHLSPCWLTRARRAGVTSMRRTRRTADAVARAGHAVHAVGVGVKRVAGQPTATRALQIYVVQKLPRRMLSRGDRIPASIDGVPVDVVEAPPAFMAADRPERGACEPMCAGISVGRNGVTFGTLGAFCRSLRPEDDGKTLLLSNRHVLVGHDGAPGDAVFQPGPGDTGTSALRQVGTLLRAWPVEPGIIANRIDAAVATVSGAGHVLTLLPGDAPRVTGATRARDNVIVCKFGRTSGFTEGFISDLSCNIVVGLDPRQPAVSATFIDQIRIDRRAPSTVFADAGDSGAAVLEKGTGQVVGLYFAGPLDGSYGIANHIGDVTDFLQIELLT